MKNTTKVIYDNLFQRYPDLVCNKDQILMAFEILVEAFKNNKKLLICGNGGSASDTEHMVAELLKNFKKKRKLKEKLAKSLEKDPELLNGIEQGYPAFSLVSQTSFISAYNNDHNPDFVYAQEVAAYGQEGDVLLAISTSGNSKNCVNAVKVANAIGMKTIGLTGAFESRINELADITIKVPEVETFKVQERHLPTFHCICAMVEEELD